MTIIKLLPIDIDIPALRVPHYLRMIPYVGLDDLVVVESGVSYSILEVSHVVICVYI